jgi:hypothetical protein
MTNQPTNPRHSLPDRRFQPTVSNSPKPKGRKTRIPRIIQEPRFLSNVPLEGSVTGFFNYGIGSVKQIPWVTNLIGNQLEINPGFFPWEDNVQDSTNDGFYQYGTQFVSLNGDPADPLGIALQHPWWWWTGDSEFDTTEFEMDSDVPSGGEIFYTILNNSAEFPELTAIQGYPGFEPLLIVSEFVRDFRISVFWHTSDGNSAYPIYNTGRSIVKVNFPSIQRDVRWNVETTEFPILYGPNGWIERVGRTKRNFGHQAKLGNVIFSWPDNQGGRGPNAPWIAGGVFLNAEQPPWYRQQWEDVTYFTAQPWFEDRIIRIVFSSRDWTEEPDTGSPLHANPGTLDNDRPGDLSFNIISGLEQIGETLYSSWSARPTTAKVHPIGTILPWYEGRDFIAAAFYETEDNAELEVEVTPTAGWPAPTNYPKIVVGDRFLAKEPFGGIENVSVDLVLESDGHVWWDVDATTHPFEFEVEQDIMPNDSRLNAFFIGFTAQGSFSPTGSFSPQDISVLGNPGVGGTPNQIGYYAAIGSPNYPDREQRTGYVDVLSNTSYTIEVFNRNGSGGFIPTQLAISRSVFGAVAKILKPPEVLDYSRPI